MRRAGFSLLAPVVIFAASIVALAVSYAEDYPTRHITLIAPWAPAGAIDTLCRELAPGLGDLLGQPVIVEDRPGAGSTIGTADAAKATPDGYTLVMAGSGALAIGPTLYKHLAYDPRKDFSPVALVAEIPFVLVVNPSLGVHTLDELIKYSKEHPGTLTYGSGGAGSPHHLYAEMLKSMTGISMTHVPYKGTTPALTDVIGGHVSLMFADAVPSLPMIRAGKVIALGVSSASRLPSAPEIPPLAEVGAPGFNAAGWGMVVAPAHTPPPIVAKLAKAVDTVAHKPEIRDRVILLGMVPKDSPPPDKLQGFIDSELVRWGKVVQAAELAGTE
jgi:tripartite-type tricarboxylate transporter receptor subunit TctC